MHDATTASIVIRFTGRPSYLRPERAMVHDWLLSQRLRNALLLELRYREQASGDGTGRSTKLWSMDTYSGRDFASRTSLEWEVSMIADHHDHNRHEARLIG